MISKEQFFLINPYKIPIQAGSANQEIIFNSSSDLQFNA